MPVRVMSFIPNTIRKSFAAQQLDTKQCSSCLERDLGGGKDGACVLSLVL